MPPIKFKAKIEGMGPGKAWAYIKFPLNVSKKFGTKARLSVRGAINGFAIRTSAMPYGDGSHHIMFNKAMQAGSKAAVGDTVLVEVEPDLKEPKVNLPADLKKALAGDADAKKMWTDITPRARVEWIDWIASAKKEDTRARRVAKTIERLASGDRRVHD